MADDARPQTIVRVQEREQGFVVLMRQTAQDTRLSYKARGMLLRIFSLPPNWILHLNEMASASDKDGLAAVRSGITELLALGYAQKVIVRRPQGAILRIEWHVSERAGYFSENTRQQVLGADELPPEPEGDEDAPVGAPTNLDEWLALLREPGANKPAILRWMHRVLYPDYPAPHFSVFGAFGKRFKDAGVMARLLWEFSDPKKRPTGDVLPFLWTVHQARRNGHQPPAPARPPQLTADEEAEWRAVLAGEKAE